MGWLPPNPPDPIPGEYLVTMDLRGRRVDPETNYERGGGGVPEMDVKGGGGSVPEKQGGPLATVKPHPF